MQNYFFTRCPCAVWPGHLKCCLTKPGFIFEHFFSVFRTLLHAWQCNRLSRIFTAPRRFYQCRRECHFNSSFLKKGTFWLFGPFERLRAPKNPKVPFSIENKPLKNDIPSIATGKNPLGPREYPGRLVTLSKRGSRARCSKIKPALGIMSIVISRAEPVSTGRRDDGLGRRPWRLRRCRGLGLSTSSHDPRCHPRRPRPLPSGWTPGGPTTLTSRQGRRRPGLRRPGLRPCPRGARPHRRTRQNWGQPTQPMTRKQVSSFRQSIGHILYWSLITSRFRAQKKELLFHNQLHKSVWMALRS